jgi:hypothetical protein
MPDGLHPTTRRMPKCMRHGAERAPAGSPDRIVRLWDSSYKNAPDAWDSLAIRLLSPRDGFGMSVGMI